MDTSWGLAFRVGDFNRHGRIADHRLRLSFSQDFSSALAWADDRAFLCAAAAHEPRHRSFHLQDDAGDVYLQDGLPDSDRLPRPLVPLENCHALSIAVVFQAAVDFSPELLAWKHLQRPLSLD